MFWQSVHGTVIHAASTRSLSLVVWYRPLDKQPSVFAPEMVAIKQHMPVDSDRS